MQNNLSQDNYEWLAIFLVYNNALYDTPHLQETSYITMEDQKNSLFHAIKDTPYDPRVKIIIVEARINALNGGLVQTINVVSKTERDFENQQISNANISMMVSTPGITQILSEIVQNNPAKKTMVITFGHGSIFGINYQPVLQGSLATVPDRQRQKFKNRQGTAPQKDGAIENALYFVDENKNKFTVDANTSPAQTEKVLKASRIKMLTNQELNEVIRDVFGGKKLDILVMYNCLMQNVFTQYELRETVDYLIAPESGICYPGYNYLSIFQRLSTNIDAPVADVALSFLNTIRSERDHRPHPNFRIDIEHTWKINVVKLEKEKYDAVKASFSDFINEMCNLTTQGTDINKCLSIVGRQLFNYSTYCLPEVKIIDLLVFLNYLPNVISGFSSLRSLLDKGARLKADLGEIQSTPFTGNNFYKSDYFYVDANYDALSKGFGMWIPDKTIDAPLLMDIVEKPDDADTIMPALIAGTKYPDFFRQYIKWNE